MWTIERTEEKTSKRYPFLRIRGNKSGNSAYPGGLISSPKSCIDSICNRYRFKEEKPLIFRELKGKDEDDFVMRVFATYYDPMIKKPDQKDHNLVLYSINRRA